MITPITISIPYKESVMVLGMLRTEFLDTHHARAEIWMEAYTSQELTSAHDSVTISSEGEIHHLGPCLSWVETFPPTDKMPGATKLVFQEIVSK